MARSYYAILGVADDASSDEIRSAYRRLAKAFHPDHYSGDSMTFRMIQEAYATLGNDEQRARYERERARTRVRERAPSGRFGYPEAEPLIAEQDPASAYAPVGPRDSWQPLTSSFDEMFDRLRTHLSGTARSGIDPFESERVQNIILEVPLSPEQARIGGNARVMLPARIECASCRGLGSRSFYACPQCAGEGAVWGELPVSVAFPPGLTGEHAVVIPLERFGIRNLRFTIRFRSQRGFGA